MARRYFIFLFLTFIFLNMLACEKKQEIVKPSKEYNISTISNDELVRLIQGKDWTTKRFVANVAVERGSGAVLKLLNMINYGDSGVNKSIQITVSGVKDKESIDSLIAFANRKKWASFSPILWGMKDFGDQGVEPLIRALQTVKHYDRSYIILSLGYIDSPKAEQALLTICSNRKDPNWGTAVVALLKKKNETARSIAENAYNTMTIGRAILGADGFYGWDSFECIDDKRFLPLHFRLAKLGFDSGKRGIARHAGKAELLLIIKELKLEDIRWVMPFVEINCAIEGVESKSKKADILWQFITDAKFYYPAMSNMKYPAPYGDSPEFGRFVNLGNISNTELPVLYAIKKLVELGDVAFPKIKKGMKSNQNEVRLRSIIALTEMLASKTSTKMLLDAFDTATWDENEEEANLRLRDRIAKELGNRKEKKAIPKLIGLLSEMENHPYFIPDNAIEALKKIGDKGVIPDMIQVWRGIKNTPENEKYKEASDWLLPIYAGKLAEIANDWKSADYELTPVLLDAMKSSAHYDMEGDYYHRRAAIQTLVRIGEPAIPAIRTLLNSKNHFGRKDYMNMELAETALKMLNAD